MRTKLKFAIQYFGRICTCKPHVKNQFLYVIWTVIVVTLQSRNVLNYCRTILRNIPCHLKLSICMEMSISVESHDLRNSCMIFFDKVDTCLLLIRCYKMCHLYSIFPVSMIYSNCYVC